MAMLLASKAGYLSGFGAQTTISSAEPGAQRSVSPGGRYASWAVSIISSAVDWAEASSCATAGAAPMMAAMRANATANLGIRSPPAPDRQTLPGH